MVDNYFALVGLVFLLIGVSVEASLIPKMIKELRRRPRDRFSELTKRLLFRPIIYVTTFSPFIPQLALLTQRHPLTPLGAWITVSVPFGLMLLAFTTYSTYTFKEKK
jgi:hypothetical protein